MEVCIYLIKFVFRSCIIILVLMLLVDNKIFKLPKTYWKMLYCAPAFDGNVCFLGMRAHREDCLSLVSGDGKLLK